nr:acylneuraminate cytidylyltransferase family protein [Acidobacteriota bacterium]
MKVLGIIPARGGSKAIPRKNLITLGKRPLLAWTCEAAKQSNLDRVVVSTDSDEIAECARSLGVEVPVMRPSHLSGDSASTMDAVIHMLEHCDEGYEAIMVLQPTSPFRTSVDINNCLSLLVSTRADSVISVVEVGGHHPARMKFLEGDRLVDPPFVEEYENQPRQELRRMYIRNGAIYLTRSSVLKRRTFKGLDCVAYVMPPERSVNIDVPFDVIVAEALVSR